MCDKPFNTFKWKQPTYKNLIGWDDNHAPPEINIRRHKTAVGTFMVYFHFLKILTEVIAA